MPVVSLEMGRLARLVGANRRRIIDRLPYVGLDIESVDESTIRVEYSPNRPDFGTDYGIAKALRGLMGIESGLKAYHASQTDFEVTVDSKLSNVRPYIASAVIQGLRLDEEDVRQLISLQEDLHNGLGRKRKRVSIGLHDLRAIHPPIRYSGEARSFKFVPLEGHREMSLESILVRTETGRAYGDILHGAKYYPILADSIGTVLSFPPIINGKATRVSTKTTGLFVDVTSTERKAGDDVLAIIATTLADMGGKIGSAKIVYPGEERVTPDLTVRKVEFSADLIRRVTGLEIDSKEMAKCLRKSRLDTAGKQALVPAYRIDILHPVDIAEEVALGYGIDRIAADYPASKQPGAFNPFEEYMGRVADLMMGVGMTELMTYELVSDETLYRKFARPSTQKIEVEGPKSIDHSLLRDSVIPSLMAALASNVKEEYPQKVFEIGRTYRRTKGGVTEEWHLGCLVGQANATFSEAKMYLDSFSKALVGAASQTRAVVHWAFAPGRTAAVSIRSRAVGSVGEIRPEVLASFGINVPLCGFEIDLTSLNKQLK